MLNRMIRILKQIICRHDYEKKPDIVLDSITLKINNKNVTYSYSRLHVCRKCEKEKIIGSGEINY